MRWWVGRGQAAWVGVGRPQDTGLNWQLQGEGREPWCPREMWAGRPWAQSPGARSSFTLGSSLKKQAHVRWGSSAVTMDRFPHCFFGAPAPGSPSLEASQMAVCPGCPSTPLGFCFSAAPSHFIVMAKYLPSPGRLSIQ